eukprot:scaffold6227_cov67-Phaeocystis_antarctica.AAC.4
MFELPYRVIGTLKLATREPGGWGRCPATRTRRRTDEDHARTPRWRATAESPLPVRRRRVRPCTRIGRICTTRAPGGPDSASQGPQCHGQCSARRSMPWGARTVTASEGL